MDSYHIWGGKPLSGELAVSAAKNAVLPILAATAMIPGETIIENCPELSDVHNMCEILSHLGCRITREGALLQVDAKGLFRCSIPEAMMKRMRSSVFLAGPLLSRCGRAELCAPGGCAIGSRPTDLHVQGLSALSAEISQQQGRLLCRAGQLLGAEVFLSYPSVGATENILMAAVSAKGETVIRNAAREPEIVDLQNFLNACGADIRGAGTEEIRIKGGRRLSPVRYRVMGDRIEGGTYLMAAAATGGSLRLRGISPQWIAAELSVLRRMGCRIEEGAQEVFLQAPSRLRSPGEVTAQPWPGFATDLQSPLLSLCASAEGTSTITDAVFERRFQCARQLALMGADIEVLDRTAVVRGVPMLRGSRVCAQDLRGGAALMIAALAKNNCRKHLPY